MWRPDGLFVDKDVEMSGDSGGSSSRETGPELLGDHFVVKGPRALFVDFRVPAKAVDEARHEV
jgi:hypothetical protein